VALSSLAQRVLTALVLVPLVLAALFVLPPGPFALAALAVVVAAAFEWARLAGMGPGYRVVFVGALLLVAGALGLRATDLASGWPPGVVLATCGAGTAFWLLVAPAWLRNGWRTTAPVAMTLVGIVVLVAFWVALVEMRARSPWLVLAAMAVVWIADTAAYFAGRAFGRRKLAPSISPGKTWEGVYGALAAVALYAVLLLTLVRGAGFDGTTSTFAAVLTVALVVALAGISVVGDLFESMLKRHAGVKDSGTLLPGHGGLLDRIDALLAAMPPAALAASAFLRTPGGA